MADVRFVLTNDDAGMQEPHLFAELLDFLDEQDVRATFFVVPFGGGVALDQKPAWIDLLQRAKETGHELQHHAWRHDSCFEFGVPPYFMLEIMPDAAEHYANEPEHFTQHHSYKILREKLEHGRDILENVFGYTPRGFRAPCLSACDAQYAALHDLDFEWVTNAVINPAGWRYINKEYEHDQEWHGDAPSHPYSAAHSVIEVPMHSEYTWYLQDEDVARHTSLARRDLDRAVANGDAFVSLSHYYAMTGEWKAGLEVYRRLFDYARSLGSVDFLTVSEWVDAAQPE